MPIPNDFLVTLQQHRNIMKTCFCDNCRRLRVQRLEEEGLTKEEIFYRFSSVIPTNLDADLFKCFADTLDIIATGKMFKDCCLNGTVYSYFKPWAKQAPMLADLRQREREFNSFCHKVNECAWIFDNWEKITDNLMDYRMSNVDARRLTVGQLYKAKNMDWCLQLNDTLRRKSKRKTGEEPLYSADKFNDIFQNIVNSGILEDIEHDPSAAASLGGRLQHAMVAYCSKRYRPY